MHIDTLAAGAGLAAIGVAGLHRGVDIGVFYDDERRLAAKFQPQYLQLIRAAPANFHARLGAARHCHQTTEPAFDQRPADHRSTTGHDVEDPVQQTCFRREARQFQAGQRCEFMRQQDEGVAGNEGRTEFAGRQSRRIVPGRQADDDAIGLAPDPYLLADIVRRQYVALDAAGIFGGIAQEGLGCGDFADSLIERFAMFGDDSPGLSVGMVAHRVRQHCDETTSLDGWQRRPSGLRRGRRLQRLDGVVRCPVCHRRDDGFIRWVQHIDPVAIGIRMPCAADEHRPVRRWAAIREQVEHLERLRFLYDQSLL